MSKGRYGTDAWSLRYERKKQRAKEQQAKNVKKEKR